MPLECCGLIYRPPGYAKVIFFLCVVAVSLTPLLLPKSYLLLFYVVLLLISLFLTPLLFPFIGKPAHEEQNKTKLRLILESIRWLDILLLLIGWVIQAFEDLYPVSISAFLSELYIGLISAAVLVCVNLVYAVFSAFRRKRETETRNSDYSYVTRKWYNK